jgi:hypothetical protein
MLYVSMLGEGGKCGWTDTGKGLGRMCQPPFVHMLAGGFAVVGPAAHLPSKSIRQP